MKKFNHKFMVLVLSGLCVCFCGCSRIREIVDTYDSAPTEPVKTTNENQYTVVRNESEIYDMFLTTMKNNKTTCYFNVADEAMINADEWAKAFDGIESVNVEYTMAQSGYNVFVTLSYWDNYPIVEAFKNNDTTTLSATQLELFSKYCDILGSCTSNSYSQYENELAIHDYLVSNVEYGGTEEDAYSAYDALIKGRAVCSGYTESFKTLLDMLGIENRVVSGTGNGEPHSWNMVQLDGEWYHVDVTWDDPINGDGSISHSYFNVPSSEMALDHVWDESAYPKADGTKYSYYAMTGMTQIRSQEELEEYVADCVNSHLENIEFMLYGDLDVNTAINRTGVALEVSYNITRKSDYDIYSMVIKYN